MKTIKIDKVLFDNGVGALEKFLEGVVIHEGSASSFILEYKEYKLKIKVKIKK